MWKEFKEVLVGIAQFILTLCMIIMLGATVIVVTPIIVVGGIVVIIICVIVYFWSVIYSLFKHLLHQRKPV